MTKGEILELWADVPLWADVRISSGSPDGEVADRVGEVKLSRSVDGDPAHREDVISGALATRVTLLPCYDGEATELPKPKYGGRPKKDGRRPWTLETPP